MRPKPRVILNDDGSIYIRLKLSYSNLVEIYVEPDQIATLISDLAKAVATHNEKLIDLLDDEVKAD